MPGPLRQQTENKQVVTPALENNPANRLRPPASNTSDPGDNTVQPDDGLFVRNGGMELKDE